MPPPGAANASGPCPRSHDRFRRGRRHDHGRAALGCPPIRAVASGSPLLFPATDVWTGPTSGSSRGSTAPGDEIVGAVQHPAWQFDVTARRDDPPCRRADRRPDRPRRGDVRRSEVPRARPGPRRFRAHAPDAVHLRLLDHSKKPIRRPGRRCLGASPRWCRAVFARCSRRACSTLGTLPVTSLRHAAGRISPRTGSTSGRTG